MAHETLGSWMLDGIRQPMMAVDARRHIALRNARAGALLEEGSLLRACGANRLHACCADNERALEEAMQELACGDRPRWAMRLKDARGAPVHVQVQRLRDSASPIAALTVFEPMPPEENESALAASFNLTPAEARVAGYLVQGMAPKQVAALCGVSPCTVRSQVRTVFEKTGVRRQPELVRLLLLASTF